MIDVGPVGIWSAGLRSAEVGAACDAAAELESHGFGALWLPGRDEGAFERVAALLQATERIVVATGIVSVWQFAAPDAASAHARLTAAHPGRFLLGLGVSHSPFVEGYEKPLETMVSYLDRLDAAPQPVPREERVLAALAPRMLRVAAERTCGTHPYLVAPEHTALARSIVGEGPLVAPEQAVALERDAGRAREIARAHLTRPYIKLPNYRRNWERQGFSEADMEGSGSDGLVDGLVAWGGEEAIVERIRQHHEAGADHVCIQVLTGDDNPLPRDEWRVLAAAVLVEG